MTVEYNLNEAQGAYTNSQNQISGAREGIPGVNGAGLGDPNLSSALEDHNSKTTGQMSDTEETLGKGKDTVRDLDETDKKSGNKVAGLGGPDALKNAMGNAGGGQPAGGSPAGGGQPSGGAPQGGGGSPSGGGMPQMPQKPMTMLSPDQLTKLLQGAGITPQDIADAKSSTGNGDGKPKDGKPIDTKDVVLKKLSDKPLSKSQMHAVINEALDNNGITKDPQVRAKWHSMLMFMAEKESSFNPSAVNLHDTNAVGPIQSDGAPARSSRGLWQTIPTTFSAHHIEGTSRNIYDPVASGSAAVHYIMHNYHVDPNGGASFERFYQHRRAGGYTGY